MARRRLALSAAAAVLAGASLWLWTAPAKAAAPSKDGWWTVTNSGLGFTPPAPQVPSGGLYIENGFTGPTAISALTFEVQQGSAVGTITLKISGNPVITSPPVACPITAAGQNYQPAQGGAWSDRPAYDCTKSQVTGTVSSDQTTVTFDGAPLLANGTVAAVILAGGQADRVAFDAPGPETLVVTPSGSGSSVNEGPSALPSGEPAGTPVGIGGAPSTAGSATGPGTSGNGLLPLQSSPGVSPALAQPQVPGNSAATAPSPRGGAGSGSRGAGSGVHNTSRISASASPLRKDAAEVIGIAALLAALVAYSEGFGLLGGRIGGRVGVRRSSQPAARASSDA